MGKSSIGSIGSDLVANNFGKLDHFITVKILITNQKGSSLMDQDEFVKSCFNHFLKLDSTSLNFVKSDQNNKTFFRQTREQSKLECS
jgi:hypothetical protein